MQYHKLFEILGTFTHKDFHRLDEFLKSPYHNKNQNLISLYNYLKKYKGVYNSKNISKENIFKFVYRKEKFFRF